MGEWVLRRIACRVCREGEWISHGCGLQRYPRNRVKTMVQATVTERQHGAMYAYHHATRREDEENAAVPPTLTRGWGACETNTQRQHVSAHSPAVPKHPVFGPLQDCSKCCPWSRSRNSCAYLHLNSSGKLAETVTQIMRHFWRMSKTPGALLC